MTKIILLRHGESMGNATGVLLGHIYYDLSPLGYRQAEATAKALRNEKIDCIYSSDLLRAYNTALPHSVMRGIDIVTAKELREMKLGLWEGKTPFQIRAEYGDMYDAEWIGNFGLFRFPGGESTVEAGERFSNECRRIALENEGKTILIVSHAAVLRAFLAPIYQIPREQISARLPFPSNASYTELYFDGKSFITGAFSVDSHLSDIGITKLNV